jgi:hypothetical protein
MVVIVAVVFLGICALFVLEYGDSHARAGRRPDFLQVDEEPVCTPCGPPATARPSAMDAFAELGFTRSLLALSKVRSPDPYGSPIPEPAESSSLVLAPHAQSQTPDREL